MDGFYSEISKQLKAYDYTPKQFAKLKRSLCTKYKLDSIPTNINILLNVPEEEIPELKQKLLTKPTRTISGVSPVALMTKPTKCPHGKCIYCGGGIGSPWGDVPQSYTGHEPATMRGIRNNYDPYLMVFNRIEQYVILGHSFDKIEIIVMGGTFTATSLEYQEEFIYNIYKALNDFSVLFFENQEFNFLKFKHFFELPGDINDKERTKRIQKKLLKLKEERVTTLKQEQEANETANIRCVALCIETKPDWALLEQGSLMLEQGCTRVEIGVQSVYDKVLKYVNRGHTDADSRKSLQILRDLGFKVNIHYMPGLPLTGKEEDIKGMKELFSNPDYRPDMIKFYPCMVAPGTPLYQLYKKGQFTPITTQEAAERIVEIKKIIPEYCRIQRIQRDVPTKMWEAGVDRTNLRQYAHDKFAVKCRCIRCREPKGKVIDWEQVKIKVQEYQASGGTEFFISAEDVENDLLIGFCRLRFPSEFLREEITKDSALIRELHVYGTATAIGEEGAVQHRGWGKGLMEKAEEIAKEHGKTKVVVISGVGVRKYYEKLGYKREGVYVVKEV